MLPNRYQGAIILGNKFIGGTNQSYPNLWDAPKWIQSGINFSWGTNQSFRFPAGQSGLGKSTMVNTLFKSKVSRKASQPGHEERIPKTVQLQSITHGTVTTTGSCSASPGEKQGTLCLRLHPWPQSLHPKSPAAPRVWSPLTHISAP